MKKIKGFSLIEILIVLGVVISIMVTAFVLFKKVQKDNQINAQIEEFNVVYSVVSEYLDNAQFMVSYDDKDQQLKLIDFKHLIPEQYIESFSEKTGSGKLKVKVEGINNISAYISRCSNLSQCSVGFNYLQIYINWGRNPANKNYDICKRITDSQILAYGATVPEDSNCDSFSTQTVISYLPSGF